jgi:hypothetical protein
MNYFKDKLLPLLVGAIISSLGAIALSISSDLVPSIMPALKTLPVQLYIKLILLLLLVLLTLSVLAFVLYLRSKDYKPRAMKGSFSGINWVAEINYSDKRHEVSIETHWLCPRHKTFLGLKDAEVPNCSYNNLFCRKCNHLYELKSDGDIVYLEEAERIIRQEILRKIRIKNV